LYAIPRKTKDERNKMTKEEELYYTLSPNDNTYDLPSIEAETVRTNRLEISTSYFKLRGRLTFGEALKESAIPVISKILKAAR